MHPALRLEKTSLAGDAVVSDTTKAESLRKRLAEVRNQNPPSEKTFQKLQRESMFKGTKIHPKLQSESMFNTVRKVNMFNTGAKVWQESEVERGQ